MKNTLLFLALLCAQTMNAEDPLLKNDWSVLAVTRGGTVSLLRNMPLSLAVKTYESLDPWKGRAEGWYYASPGDIQTREIIGPDGWDGCKKDMRHDFDLKDIIVDSAPNKGRTHRSGFCKKCGEHKFEWTTELDYKGARP